MRAWRLAAPATLLLCPAIEATEWVVVPTGPPLAETIEAAAPGDTLRIRSGRYSGPLVIDRPLQLLGEGSPVIDGGGRGSVITVRTPGVTISGLTIRNSGDSLDEESSGIALDESPGARIVDNRLEGVLFGIYLRKSPGTTVARNTIRSQALPLARRGDAIRIWYSDGVLLDSNRIQGARDVVLWYSERLAVRGNRVESGRYGLHFMYCDDARIERNVLRDNSVGAFLMYSRRLRLIGNTIVGNHGPSGYGVGLKDMDDAQLRHNVFATNRIGTYLDNSPREQASAVTVEGNLFTGNTIGVSLLPNVRRGLFLDNSFVANAQQVSLVGGGGVPTDNVWRRNHWSDYAGYDADGDDLGDLPHRVDRLFGALADRRPELRLFAMSPIAHAADFAARAFPVVRPRPTLVDPEPRMRAQRPVEAPDVGTVGERRLAPIGGGMALAAVLLLLWPRFERSRRPSRPSTSGRTPQGAGGSCLIEVRGLGKSFGGQPALCDLSFSIEAGEAVALWGPNGAGKTTALRTLLGLLPFEGHVRVAGLDPWRRGKEARAQIGFVPQEVHLHGQWRVDETCAFFARLRRVPRSRVEALLVELGISAEVDKRVRELSGGLRQRLALVVALLSDPPLLLLDEPTANLDAESRAELVALLGRLKLGGKTLLFTSHRAEEVLALADRVLSLKEGRLVASGPPRQVLPGGGRRTRMTLMLAERDLDRAEAELEAGRLACRRSGSRLLVWFPDGQKVEPIARLLAVGIRPLDFTMDGADRGADEADGGAA